MRSASCSSPRLATRSGISAWRSFWRPRRRRQKTQRYGFISAPASQRSRTATQRRFRRNNRCLRRRLWSPRRGPPSRPWATQRFRSRRNRRARAGRFSARAMASSVRWQACTRASTPRKIRGRRSIPQRSPRWARRCGRWLWGLSRASRQRRPRPCRRTSALGRRRRCRCAVPLHRRSRRSGLPPLPGCESLR